MCASVCVCLEALMVSVRLVSSAPEASKRSAHAIALSLLLSPGLLIIDHIHFQYNGFMYGLLLLSLLLARSPSTLLPSGLVFAILLCFKHIYLYLAPAYFVFLLRAYCLGPSLNVRFANCVKLAAGVLAVFAVALGPFVYWGQLPQLAARLFPFSRGLCHAYWAPNVWAIYSFVDRALIPVAPRLGLGIGVDAAAINSGTRGLVGDTAFAVLPEITPRTTFLLTLLCQSLPLVKLFANPSFDNFVGAVTLCGYASFLFGWHVHEKAILLVIFPFRFCHLRPLPALYLLTLVKTVCWRSKTVDTSAPSAPWQSQATSPSSHCSSRPPSFPSKRYTRSHGLSSSCSPLTSSRRPCRRRADGCWTGPRHSSSWYRFP